MPENNLFEYAIVRVVPQVEREEFLNVGVVLYCAGKKFLQASFEINAERLKHLSPKLDIPEIIEYLKAFSEICKGSSQSGPIGKLPVAERFRWLTATRSTVVQTSRVHPGLCEDPGDMLKQLHAQFVSF